MYPPSESPFGLLQDYDHDGALSTADFFPDLDEQQFPVAQPAPQIELGPAPSHAISPRTSPLLARNAGITKKKRRTVPPKELKVIPGDEKSERTKRNTLAARKSRAKRYQHLVDLEKSNEELVTENQALKQRIQQLESRV